MGLAEGLAGAPRAAAAMADQDPGASASSSPRVGPGCGGAAVCRDETSPVRARADKGEQWLCGQTPPSAPLEGFPRSSAVTPGQQRTGKPGVRSLGAKPGGDVAPVPVPQSPGLAELAAPKSGESPVSRAVPCRASGSATQHRGHRGSSATQGKSLPRRFRSSSRGAGDAAREEANRTETLPKTRPP